MNDKLLYFHINNSTGEIFYVGIGSTKRPYKKQNRSRFWNNIVDKHGYDIIIEEDKLTWEQACELEMYWIKRIGRRDLGLGTLVNLTDGGDGAANHSDENRMISRKIGLSNKGKKRSEETKKRMSEAASICNTGRLLSTDTKKLIGINSGKSRLGKKRGIYKNNKINK